MTEANRVNTVEGLFAETAEGPRLLGSKCRSCDTPYFPKSERCHNPDCDASDMHDAHFGPRGTLWSTAIQNYPPPPPVLYDEPFEPYGVGLVDLPDGLRVLGRLQSDAPEAVEVGSEVELVLAPLQTSEDGEQLISWQWKPVGKSVGKPVEG